jgi:hypothetical protein
MISPSLSTQGMPLLVVLRELRSWIAWGDFPTCVRAHCHTPNHLSFLCAWSDRLSEGKGPERALLRLTSPVSPV